MATSIAGVCPVATNHPARASFSRGSAKSAGFVNMATASREGNASVRISSVAACSMVLSSNTGSAIVWDDKDAIASDVFALGDRILDYIEGKIGQRYLVLLI